MGKKLERTVTKAAYGLLGIASKPVYDQMRKEVREINKRWDEINNRASQDAMAEMRRFEVRQPFDAIIHKSLW